MEGIVIGVVTTVAGVVLTILISRHYFVRSISHRLAVYALPSPSILYGVDPEIRDGLTMQFRGETVNELNIVEFIVVNEGASVIRDTIRPLTFTLPQACRIVDASITSAFPPGREVSVNIDTEAKFTCNFLLLNSNEYFYVKLITDGPIRASEVGCSIVAAGLPPSIPIRSAASISIANDDESKIAWRTLTPAAICLAISGAISSPIMALYETSPNYFPFDWAKFHFVWWLIPSIIIIPLLSIGLLALSIFMTLTALVGDFPRRQQFRRPGLTAVHQRRLT